MWFLFAFVFCQSSFHKRSLQLDPEIIVSKGPQSLQEIMEFLFGHEITDAQRQKALDAAVAEDLNRGEPSASFSFQGNQLLNHTSDVESL